MFQKLQNTIYEMMYGTNKDDVKERVLTQSLYRSFNEMTSSISQTRQTAQIIRSKMDELLKRIDEFEAKVDKTKDLEGVAKVNLNINDLGELQGLGPNLDRLCGLTDRAIQDFTWTAKVMAELTK